MHPRLRDYFSQIPAGSVGRGIGTFAAVGTPRRWLWPVLGVLARDGVVFAVWEHDVPFSIVNRPTPNGVLAEREFTFARATRVMTDAIVFSESTLVDRLGRRGRVVVTLHASVVDGALHVRSSRVAIAGVGIPRFMAPRVRLTERFDDTDELQHVALTLIAPVLGRIYEYAGSFHYSIEAGE
jgi:hypothetical protein